jgi:hypothetical protein
MFDTIVCMSARRDHVSPISETRSRAASAPRTARIGIVALVLAACGALAGVAWALDSFSITAYFTPDKLGASTNLSASAKFAYSTSAPVPVSNVLAYGPAGLEVDLKGTGTCNKTALENTGPSGCPANSRIGFGGGVGLVEIAKEFIKEPFTFDLFLAPSEQGRFVVLIYVNATDPVSLQLVLSAKEVHGPRPYGIGVTFEVPPIPTLPGAAYASVESAYLTVGSQKVAYFDEVHGHRQLVHVKGLVVPRSCPHGGFPFQVTINFLDHTSSIDKYQAPCPRR